MNGLQIIRDCETVTIRIDADHRSFYSELFSLAIQLYSPREEKSAEALSLKPAPLSYKSPLEEEEDWKAHRRESEASRLALLQNWQAVIPHEPLKLAIEQAHVLLMILNDLRLAISELEEIEEINFEELTSSQTSPQRRKALIQLWLSSCVQHLLMQALEPGED
jgi:hypothetical protein